MPHGGILDGATGVATTREATAVAGYEMQKEQILKRLARIEGQVRGIARMVDEDRYCIDVLDQVSAITRALQQVSIGLVHDHLGHCVAEAVREGGPDVDAKLDEATAAIARLVRS
jgi:CsoR family transcriptional regulator, copper-sensing transcriptional repressor